MLSVVVNNSAWSITFLGDSESFKGGLKEQTQVRDCKGILQSKAYGLQVSRETEGKA